MTATLPNVAATERMRQLPEALHSYAGFAEAIAALASGQPASFDGVWGSSCALLAAALALKSHGPILVVTSQQREADDFAADLEFFFPARPALFPAWEIDPSEQVVQEEAYGERLRTLKQFLGGARELAKDAADKVAEEKSYTPHLKIGGARRDDNRELTLPARQDEDESARQPKIVVTSIPALLQKSPAVETIAAGTRRLKRGDRVDVDGLLHWLAERGFQHTSAVELPGEFYHRGGLLDIFAPDWNQPVRIEFFDDEIDSIRKFDVSSQRSLATLDEIDITVLPRDLKATGHLTDFLPASTWVLLLEPQRIVDEGRNYLQRAEKPAEFHNVADVLAQCSHFAVATAAGILQGTSGVECQLPIESVERFSGDISKVRDELDLLGAEQEIFVASQTDAEIERLREILATTRHAAQGRLHFPLGSLRAGFRLRSLPLAPTARGKKNDAAVSRGVVIITGGELFHRGELRRVPRRRLGKAIDSFLDLREGDLIVHLAHGIGRYRGLRLLDKQGQAEEHLEIEFDGGTKMYVPAVKIDLVQKYIGGTKTHPQLAKIGGKTWLRQKEAAESAVADLATEMLEMQALRAARPGITFATDSDWQREFDATFPYTETPDQLSAIAAIKGDMQRGRPMDRLLCGDVGFGKTEVAMRATFKAVDSGYQVAVLVPTTILAEQHYRSFCERLAEFPFDIAKLSRFCTPQEERVAVEGLKSGRIDLVIGTHRLASKDVEFHNLGLVIIDEEQRFGVDVKERLKTLRTTVDVLTLSATPIPRTLHMSLVGLRDISNLESPPEDRIAVETKVTRFNQDLIRHAVLRELSRDGQIYFVHNRVHDIELLANRLRHIVPEARIRIGHGQMGEGELERVMVDFVEHKFDLLLATTIVESGLDIPNANTIFIDEADHYGLADLHQLRGRVGRYKNRAFCYLLLDPGRHITPNAARRLRAIEEFSEMGAGFAIAMRDLEIRGAGNLLGTQQSGHIAAVGYELYCQLLENAVRSLQKMAPKISLDVDLKLPGDAYMPPDYVGDMRLKIDLYRRLTRVSNVQELADFRAELVDRFGPLPGPVERLMSLAELKMDAALWQVSEIFIENNFVVFRYDRKARIEHLAKLQKGRLRIVDDKSAYLPLPPGTSDPDAIFDLVKSILRPPK
jgi:transcription-repair coupling factor (superfamily II helicase)